MKTRGIFNLNRFDCSLYMYRTLKDNVCWVNLNLRPHNESLSTFPVIRRIKIISCSWSTAMNDGSWMILIDHCARIRLPSLTEMEPYCIILPPNGNVKDETSSKSVGEWRREWMPVRRLIITSLLPSGRIVVKLYPVSFNTAISIWWATLSVY